MYKRAHIPVDFLGEPQKTRARRNLVYRAAFTVAHLLTVTYLLGTYFPDMLGYRRAQTIGPGIIVIGIFAIIQLEVSWRAKSVFFRNMLIVLNTIVIIPALGFYHFTENHLMSAQINLCFAMLQISGYYQLPHISLKPAIQYPGAIGLAFIALPLGIILLSNGLNPELLTDITLVYSFRETVETSTTIFLSGLIMKFLLPLFIMQKYEQMPLTVLTSSVVICMLLFVSTGHKSVVGFAIMFLFYKHFRGNLVRVLLLPLLAISLISIVAILMNLNLLAAVLVRRIFLIQPFLFEIWHGVFAGGPIPFWGTIFPLNLFGYYPFDKPIIFIVGEVIGGWPNTSIIMETIVNSGPFFPFFALFFGFLMHVAIAPIRAENRGFVGFLVGASFVNGSFASVFMDPTVLLLFIALALFASPPAHRN